MAKGISKDNGRLYPDDLLKAPIAERMKFFHDSIVGHDLFDSVMNQIEQFIHGGRRGTMIMLVGPSGAGKSALGKKLHVKISEEFFKCHPEDLHTIPSVFAEAWADEYDRFDWHNLYEDLLTELQAPLISDSLPEVKKIIAGRELLLPDLSVRSQPTLRTLSQRYRRVIVERNPSMVFLDEASYVMLSPRKQRVMRRATTLRSMVNRSNTLLVACGGYDLYDLVLQSGQLARRGNVMHLRVYLPSERPAFGRALIGLQNCLPCKIRKGDLDYYGDELERESLRSVGHLKTILMNAQLQSSNLGKPIDKEILERSFYKPQQLEVLRNDIFDGYWLVEGHRHPEDKRELETGRSGAHAEQRTAGHRGRGVTRPVGKVLPMRRPLGGNT